MLDFPRQELHLRMLEGGCSWAKGQAGRLDHLWVQGKVLAGIHGERNPLTENAFLNLRYLWRAALLYSIIMNVEAVFYSQNKKNAR